MSNFDMEELSAVEERFETIAMTVISYAGDAKNHVYRALDIANQGNLEEANKLLDEARQRLQEVHNQHRELMDKVDLNELDHRYIFLLIHAEDIFISTMSECELVSRIINK